MKGSARLADRAVDLATVTASTLVVVAERDEFIPSGEFGTARGPSRLR